MLPCPQRFVNTGGAVPTPSRSAHRRDNPCTWYAIHLEGLNNWYLTQKQVLIQRFRKTNHMLTDLQLVIPGRRSEAEANPESNNH
jgi:hypothetical protein